MFPLGAVLFPSLVLPLHVFEPRYRTMVRHCLDGEPEFGVALIERGSEVGGGEVRSQVGTMARIIEAAELDDGRWVLGTVGTRRVRVVEWLVDDPYPQAEVEDWPDVDLEADHDEAYAAATAVLRRVLALRTELAEPSAPATVELSDDPALGSYQISALGPFGPSDQQALLRTPGVAGRLELLTDLLTTEAGFAAQRLELG